MWKWSVSVGDLVARGRTSDVYAYGTDSVVKVLHADVPSDWASFEATLTSAVRDAGVRAPEVRDLVDVGGRDGVVFERIHGLSMWQHMVASPDDAVRLAHELSAIQRSLLSIGIPDGVPDLVDRMSRKLAVAPGLPAAERQEALELADSLPRGAALLHGDLHPGNILMSKSGPVVIDWFDAAIGHPIADIVRSTILIQPHRAAAPQHLPDAQPELLARVSGAYVGDFAVELERAGPDLHRWRAVVAAGRLTEGAEADESSLIALWHARNSDLASNDKRVAR